MIIKDVAAILSTAGIESLATLHKQLSYHDNSPLVRDVYKRQVFDPEIELDIYNLGLIYEITIDENGHCYFLMTFTDTGCGCEETMPYEIAEKLKSIDGINSVKVETTYSPVWKMTRISRYGRIALGISPRGGK